MILGETSPKASIYLQYRYFKLIQQTLKFKIANQQGTSSMAHMASMTHIASVCTWNRVDTPGRCFLCRIYHTTAGFTDSSLTVITYTYNTINQRSLPIAHLFKSKILCYPMKKNQRCLNGHLRKIFSFSVKTCENEIPGSAFQLENKFCSRSENSTSHNQLVKPVLDLKTKFFLAKLKTINS